jgi:[ribosomal protein S5]-alanine N-acetyltransferase
VHQCFANAEAMRFWNHPVHTKRIETERAVRRFIDCTPSYYRFWAVADAKTDRCLGMVNYHDGHIRSKRVAIGYVVDPALHGKGIATEAVSAMLDGELANARIAVDVNNHGADSLIYHRIIVGTGRQSGYVFSR